MGDQLRGTQNFCGGHFEANNHAFDEHSTPRIQFTKLRR